MRVCLMGLMEFLLMASAVFAQDASVITRDQEPHDHRVLRSDYAKAFNVKVWLGDSIAQHKHDQDTVVIAMSDQPVTVGIPGKPDVHSKSAGTQVRLPPRSP